MSGLSPAPFQTIELLPSQIKTDPQFNVRPFSSSLSDSEDALIQSLALSLEQKGQLDNLLITPAYIVVAGHRRRKAAIVVNERRSARGQPLFRLRCTVDSSGGDMWQKSIASNLERKDISPMDLAYLCRYVRDKFQWHTPHDSILVGKYLNLDRTYIQRIELLLTANKELQNQVHEGQVSMANALAILRQLPDSKTRAVVLQRAAEIQEDQREDKIIADWKANKKCLTVANRMMSQPKPRIERKAIEQAMTEMGTVAKKPSRALSCASLLSGISALDDPSLSASHRAFIRYTVDVFAKGSGSQKELMRKFSAIASKVVTLAS